MSAPTPPLAAKFQRGVALVAEGVDPRVAADQVGVTWAALRTHLAKAGVLSPGREAVRIRRRHKITRVQTAAQIIERWDRGETAVAIAAALDVTTTRVRRVVEAERGVTIDIGLRRHALASAPEVRAAAQEAARVWLARDKDAKVTKNQLALRYGITVTAIDTALQRKYKMERAAAMQQRRQA